MRRSHLTKAAVAALCAVVGIVVAVGAWQAPQLALANPTGEGSAVSTADEFPGTPSDVTANDKTWDLTALDPNTQTFQSKNVEQGDVDGLKVDATAGKFGPRNDNENNYHDTQVNAGTVIWVPVAQSEGGATLTVSGSTYGPSFTVGGQEYKLGDRVELDTSGEAHYVKVEVVGSGSAYLTSITVAYNANQPDFPGEPSGVEAKDRTWEFKGGTDDETDSIQGKQSVLENGLAVDTMTSGAKWGPRPNDVQVNGGTKIYVPVAQSDAGATLTISGNANGQTIKVDGEDYTLGTQLPLDTKDGARYVAVEVSGAGSAYLTSISIDYVADTSTYPGTPQNVTATDKTWDFTSDEAVQRPAAESGQRAEFDGIRVDATVGRFSPRSGENQDTQVNAGTILYVPVAADPKGATLRVEGNNYNNLTITVDGEEQKVGTDIALDAADTAYVAVAFSSEDGNGSCYLSSISVDYGSDTTQDYHVVTVGASGDYRSIQDALDHETSSLKDHLVLSIAPGDYYERVVVSQPGVIFQNADETGENAVVIRASYYSSNVRNDDGEYVKQDEFDLGTDRCATVLIESTGTGFSASNITFQNDYNVVDHTGEGEQTPAVAFNSKADKVELQNCSFIGRQDTLYVQGAGNRVFLTGCYVEGTVDFVFGDADAYFEGCQLHMAAFPGRTSGYYTAANTKAGYVGLVFSNCTLTADSSLTDVSLGRPWQNLCYYSGTVYDSNRRSYYVDVDTTRQHPDYKNVSSAVSFVGCTMPSNLKSARWNEWTGREATLNKDGKTYTYAEDSTSVTYKPTVRFQEFGSKNADGSLASCSSDAYALGFGQFKFDANADTAQVLAGLLAQMGIGSDGWDPADLAFQNDGSFWTPASSLRPGQSTNSPTGGNTGNNNPGSSDSATSARDGLAQTSDSTNHVLPVVLVVAAVVLIGGAVYLRKRRS